MVIFVSRTNTPSALLLVVMSCEESEQKLFEDL
jgi:hypothetical protein